MVCTTMRSGLVLPREAFTHRSGLPIAPSRQGDGAWLLWRCAALITSAGLKQENRRRGQVATWLFIYLKKSVDVTGEFGQKAEKNERFL